MKKIIRKITASLLLAPMMMGCLSFKGGKFPVKEIQHLSKPASKETVSVSLKFMNGKKVSKGSQAYNRLFIDNIKKSGFFSDVEMSKPGQKPAGREFRFIIRNGMGILSMISVGISAFFFGWIPGIGKDNYDMDVQVYEKGKLVKTYKYRHHMWTVVYFFLIPFFRTPFLVQNEILKDMQEAFLYDYHKDFLDNKKNARYRLDSGGYGYLMNKVLVKRL